MTATMLSSSATDNTLSVRPPSSAPPSGLEKEETEEEKEATAAKAKGMKEVEEKIAAFRGHMREVEADLKKRQDVIDNTQRKMEDIVQKVQENIRVLKEQEVSLDEELRAIDKQIDGNVTGAAFYQSTILLINPI